MTEEEEVYTLLYDVVVSSLTGQKAMKRFTAPLDQIKEVVGNNHTATFHGIYKKVMDVSIDTKFTKIGED
jgi:hypothetical protein